jgi:hypothetical protein
VRLFSEEDVVCEVLYNFGNNHEATPHTTAVILRYLYINQLRRDNCWGYKTFVRQSDKIIIINKKDAQALHVHTEER